MQLKMLRGEKKNCLLMLHSCQLEETLKSAQLSWKKDENGKMSQGINGIYGMVLAKMGVLIRQLCR